MNFILTNYEPLNYIFIAGFSFLLVFLGIPSIIHVANKLRLYDDNRTPRKSHGFGISRLGGIAVFSSLFITLLLFSDFSQARTANYLLTALILIFAVGLKDDLWGVNPGTKFLIQLISALIVVVLADIRISHMHGIAGIGSLPYWVSVVFSTVLIIFITNAFNLIDGIDGLVGVTALMVSLSFGLFFAYMGRPGMAGLAFTLTGASLGFLKFNVSPAKIFMGDAGSMLIGLVAAVLAIRFIEVNLAGNGSRVWFVAAPAIGMAILIGPIFDAIRVFCLRLLKGQSPFVADNNHTHHRLLRLGFTHQQASIILMSFNNVLLTSVIYFRELGNEILIAFLFASSMAFSYTLTLLLKRDEKRTIITNRILKVKPAHHAVSPELTQLRAHPGELTVEAPRMEVRSGKTGT